MPLIVPQEPGDIMLNWQQASLPSRSIIERWMWGYGLLRGFGNSRIRSLMAGWHLGVLGKKTLIHPSCGWRLRPDG